MTVVRSDRGEDGGGFENWKDFGYISEVIFMDWLMYGWGWGGL